MTDFKGVCENAWVESAQATWSQKMDSMTNTMRTWAVTTPNPQNRIRAAEHNLDCFQTLHPNLQDPSIGAALVRDLNKAEDDLEEYWRQRSRVQWHVQGDRNTSYFHITATQRKRRNMIGKITAENGDVVTEERLITRVFV